MLHVTIRCFVLDHSIWCLFAASLQTTFWNVGIVRLESCAFATIHWDSSLSSSCFRSFKKNTWGCIKASASSLFHCISIPQQRTMKKGSFCLHNSAQSHFHRGRFHSSFIPMELESNGLPLDWTSHPTHWAWPIRKVAKVHLCRIANVHVCRTAKVNFWPKWIDAALQNLLQPYVLALIWNAKVNFWPKWTFGPDGCTSQFPIYHVAPLLPFGLCLQKYRYEEASKSNNWCIFVKQIPFSIRNCCQTNLNAYTLFTLHV